jgi:hypothetical protein
MTLRMKLDELFKVGDKTILAGALETSESAVSNVTCALEVDGKEVGQVKIEGEVQSGTGRRDLWTRSPLPIGRDVLKQHDVWLIAR